jgi:hypothetical protein
MLSGNYDQTMNSFSTGTRPDGINAPKNREDFENGSRVAAVSFQGQQMLAKKIISDDKVDLEVLAFFEGHAPDISVQHMVKEGGQWKFSGSASVRQDWEKDGKVQTYAPSTGQ